MQPKRRQWVLMAILVGLLSASTQDRFLMSRVRHGFHSPQVRWLSSVEEARVVAAREKRPIFVEFSATWCEPCQEMLAETYQDPDVADRLNKEFVPVLLDIDRHKDTAIEYGVLPIPDQMFLASDGQRQVLRSYGYHDADTLIAFMNGAKKKAILLSPLPSGKDLPPSAQPFNPQPPMPNFPLGFPGP